MPFLQSLQTGGYSWEVLLYALGKAKFQQSLKSLSLLEINLHQSDVPLYDLMTSPLIPRLEELQIAEAPHQLKPNTAGPIWQSMALPHTHRSDSANTSQFIASRVAGSAGGQQQYLKSLALTRFAWAGQEKRTWAIADLSKDLSNLGHTIRHMTLDLPAEYCQTVARDLRQTLPHLTKLGLKLDLDSKSFLCNIQSWLMSNLDVEADDLTWHSSFCSTLQLASSLESLHLTCEDFPVDIYAALPSTLQSLHLAGCFDDINDIALGDPLQIDMLSSHLRKNDWLPALTALTYEPDFEEMMDEVQDSIEMEMECGDSDLPDVLDDAETYLGKLKKLRKRCKKRSVTLNCDSIEELANLIERMEDALEDNDEEEERDSYVGSDEEFSWEDVHAFHQ